MLNVRHSVTVGQIAQNSERITAPSSPPVAFQPLTPSSPHPDAPTCLSGVVNGVLLLLGW